MTLYLVRHASAGTRGTGVEDLERSLDDVGRTQANSVAERLVDVGIDRLCSSPARRCIETLEPAAARLEVEIDVEAALLEDQSADAAVGLLHRLAGEGHTAALCTHGDLIPEILHLLGRDGMVIVGPRRWEKGSVWQLDTSGPDLVRARYLG